MVTIPTREKISFAEYLNYSDRADKCYELVDGELLLLMTPASFLHSDIIDFIADLLKTVVRENKLDLKVKTGDVGIRTGIASSRIPDISVIDGQTWKSYGRKKSAVVEGGLLLAVEVVSPGAEQISRDYTDKVVEYQDTGIPEYWIVDPIEQKVTILVLGGEGYSKTVFTEDDILKSAIFPELKVTVQAIISV